MKSLSLSSGQKLSSGGNVLVDVFLDSGELVKLDLSIGRLSFIDVFLLSTLGGFVGKSFSGRLEFKVVVLNEFFSLCDGLFLGTDLDFKGGLSVDESSVLVVEMSTEFGPTCNLSIFSVLKG
jgi:hypothetical protein